MSGSIALVGAGPGDAELLTLKAVRFLRAADVVLYDALASPETLAFAREGVEKIQVGKRGYGEAMAQADINALMVKLALEGKRVVRLKGGDPAVFGRATEEIAAARAANIPVEIVPGVTAAQGAAATLTISLTQRDHARRLQYITAHDHRGELPETLNWHALADPHATTAIYMPGRKLAECMAKLQEHGLPATTPAVAVMDATKPTQRIIHGTIADLPAQLAAETLEGPVTVLIGGVVQDLRE